MSGIDLAAIMAVLMAAAAVLPGTLGILMYTHTIAADDSGARFIYGRALWVLIVSLVLMGLALFSVVTGAGASAIFIWSFLFYAGILVFGFFMHTTMLFRPIKKPLFISLEEAISKFGPGEEVVGVIDAEGKPWAFVSKLARRPHIVYQPEGEAPFLMTHCILAHSSMSYAMKDKFKQPDIRITAVLANNMVFYEKTNQCSVIQLHNRSRNQQLGLTTVSTVAVSLGTWQKLYPESKVWIRNIEWRDVFYLKLLARADVIDPDSPVMVYPLQHPLDERLPMKSQVIGVQIGDQAKTYSEATCREEKLINDELDGTALLFVSAFGGDYVQVYDRSVEGRILSFDQGDSEDQFKDIETGSKWNLQGRCIDGALKGRNLTPIPHYNKIFWYVWSDFHHGAPIYGQTFDTPEKLSVPAA